MSDPLPTDAPLPAGGVSESDRDAKIEQLLLVGLDHYFVGEYEHAINVWTRALFLDRSHPRARAYIDRARAALAERQRESEELLQNGVAAFERGEVDEARRLLQAAIGRGAPPDEALAVLERLNRLDPAASAHRTTALRSERMPNGSEAAAVPARTSRRLLAWAVAVVLVAASGLGAARVTGWSWRSLQLDVRVSQAPSSTATPESPSTVLALPRRGETALARARALQASGHLRDALTALDEVKLTDPERVDADRIRIDIQHQLLSVAARSAPASAPAATGDGHLP